MFTLNWIFVSSASVVSVLFFVYGKFISEAVQSINILSFCVKKLISQAWLVQKPFFPIQLLFRLNTKWFYFFGTPLGEKCQKSYSFSKIRWDKWPRIFFPNAARLTVSWTCILEWSNWPEILVPGVKLEFLTPYFLPYIVLTNRHRDGDPPCRKQYDKVSANTASWFPLCYKKSDGSQDAHRGSPDIPN